MASTNNPDAPAMDEEIIATPNAGDDPKNTGYALKGLWYFAMPSNELFGAQLVTRTILGEDLVFGRSSTNTPFCLIDRCPHRGIPLRFGKFDGNEVECCYHGWRFATDGCLKAIPSLVESQAFDNSRVRVKNYPCRESNGNVWVFIGDDIAGSPDINTDSTPFDLDNMAIGPMRIHEKMVLPCTLDHAVMGLMDPAHGPFVHASWWWRPTRSAHEKAKEYAPSPLGFTMSRHRPSSNSRAYALLGGAPETEIAFQLPGVRLEHIRVGKHQMVNLTTLTPIGPKATEINQMIYWTMPWLTLAKPVLRHFVRAFLGQDRDIIARQQIGLEHNPPLRLIDDADTPAKWYLKIKREFANAQAEGRAFKNPVEKTTLRWRS
ncbi:MAG: Rieske 2Fe-2S domain-containing protein [Alphaproteobacteria bacterium]